MKFFKHIGTAVALAAIGMFAGHGSAPAAQTDSDVLNLTANIVAAMNVTSQGDVAIGDIPQGTTVDVEGDGTCTPAPCGGGTVTATHFHVDGPTGLNWTLTVAYTPLSDGVPADDMVLSSSSTAAKQICVDNTYGSQAACTNKASGSTWTKVTEHDGTVSAWVGYHFVVAAAQPTGSYTGTVTLTATALLGT